MGLSVIWYVILDRKFSRHDKPSASRNPVTKLKKRKKEIQYIFPSKYALFISMILK